MKLQDNQVDASVIDDAVNRALAAIRRVIKGPVYGPALKKELEKLAELAYETGLTRGEEWKGD